MKDQTSHSLIRQQLQLNSKEVKEAKEDELGEGIFIRSINRKLTKNTITSSRSINNHILLNQEISSKKNLYHHHQHHHPNHHYTSTKPTTLTMKKNTITTRSNPNTLTTTTTSTSLKLAFFAFISLLLVMLTCINVAHSLNCYHCSSVDNPDCDEAFAGRANITETDCEKIIGKPAKVCRKIVQYIEHKKVVIRSCGFIDDHDEKDRKAICYKRSGTFAIMMESCNCYTDNCNHSASLVPNQSVLLFILIASCSMILLSRCSRGSKQ